MSSKIERPITQKFSFDLIFYLKKLGKIEDSNRLNVIKHEYKHRYRISQDVHDDARGAKIVFDNLKSDTQKLPILGYIQELSLDPFGFCLTSDIQV